MRTTFSSHEFSAALESCQAFAGRNALVTGGTTGIGRAAALLLARAGANVLVFGRHEKELRDTLREAEGAAGELDGLTADQSNPDDVDRVFRRVDEAMGSLDFLVNNAGVADEDLKDITDGEINYIVRTNLCGYMYCARRAARRMKDRRGGHIVHIGSISAENCSAGGEIYTATKAGIRAFSESVRRSLQEDGVRVSLVEPGRTGSDMTGGSPEKEAELKMMKAEDVAELVCFCLLQPERSVLTSVQIEPFGDQQR